jgi:hypothetical protein
MGVTKLSILVDTHIVPTSSVEEKSVTDVLRNLLDTLNTKASYLELFVPHLSQGTKLREVRMLSSAIETGTKYNRLHFHCVIQITHTGKFLLTSDIDGINITGRIREWVIERLPYLSKSSDESDESALLAHESRSQTLPFVRVNLADSSAENYATKSTKTD